jgi:hypothetical protein
LKVETLEMGEQFRLDAETYGTVSEFYVALWEHLDLLMGGTRWLHTYEVLPFEEREAKLVERFEAITSMPLDRRLIDSLRDQLNKTINLARLFKKTEGGDSKVRGQVEDWKITVQELGLEFARLEVVNLRDG